MWNKSLTRHIGDRRASSALFLLIEGELGK